MEVDPRKTTVDLKGFGEDNGKGESSYTFISRDKIGNPVESNTLFAGKIISNETGAETEVVIEPKGKGNYQVRFPILAHGVYVVVLGISSASKAIIQDMVKGSPFTVRVGPDPAKPKKTIIEPKNCYVFGPGAVKSAVKRKSSFTIQAIGLHGEKLSSGGDKFKAKITPPAGTNKLASLPCNLVDQQDGTYTVSYSPNAPGFHLVHITESDNDNPINGSPFSITVTDTVAQGEEVDPKTAAIHFGEVAETVGLSVFAFPISFKSFSGGKMQLSTQVRAKVFGPTGLDVQHKVVELEDGRFLLKFVPKNHGLYQFEVDVCTNGNDKFAPVKGSPSELELYLTIDDEGNISSAKVLKVSPIVKQEEKKVSVSAPTSPVPNQNPLKGPPLPSAAALILNHNNNNNTKSPQSPKHNTTSIPLGSGSNSNNQARIPPKNPTTVQQRRFSSPPAFKPAPLVVSTPPKNPSPGSPSLSANPPSWLVASKKQ